jgi:ribosomal protein L32
MNKKFIKKIIFTKTPLLGKFRYKDEFQIYPLNLRNAPNSANTSHFPMIIEFWIDENEIPEIKEFESENVNRWIAETTAQTNKLLLITSLLSSISNFRFFFYRTPEVSWTIPLPEKKVEKSDADINKISKWSASLYYYPDIEKDIRIECFSKSDIDAIPFLPNKLYYWYDPVENKKKAISLPDTIYSILDKYYSLNNEELKIVNSAIYQLCNGLDLHNKMKSLSFFSIVSSIETLVNYEFRNEKIEFECNNCKSIKTSDRICSNCGKPIWGISAKFREFLFKYVSNDPKAKKMYNKIYDLRSKIAHTDYLINNENFLNWNFSDKTEELSIRHLEAIQLSRRSIVNWLLKNK